MLREVTQPAGGTRLPRGRAGDRPRLRATKLVLLHSLGCPRRGTAGGVGGNRPGTPFSVLALAAGPAEHRLGVSVFSALFLPCVLSVASSGEASRPAPPPTPGAFWPIFQPSLPFSRCLAPSTHLSRRRALGPEQTQHGPFWETWQVPTRHLRPGSSRNWSRDKGAGTRGWAGRWQSRETRRGRGKVRREEGGPPG